MGVRDDGSKPSGDACRNPWSRFSGCGTAPFIGPAYEFPNQFQYSQDIGWLIKAYKYWICMYKDILDKVNEIAGSLDGLDEYIRNLVANAVQPAFEQIGLLREEMKDFTEATDEKLEQMTKRIEGIQKIVASLEVFVNSILPAARAYADAKDDELKEWILRYISTIAKQWPPVIDPSDGLMEDINTALKHIYNDAIDGITYNQLNGYGITYNQLNNMHITYRMLNTKMFKLLDRELDRRFYMFSPVNGEWLRWDKVIWQLYRLHFKGTTYEAFDAKGITYDELNAMMRTYQQLNEYGLEDIVR